MNNVPDLSPFIKGVFVVTSFAIALGQYPKLEAWARKQAIEAVAWKEPHPYFFSSPAHHQHHYLKNPRIHSEGGGK